MNRSRMGLRKVCSVVVLLLLSHGLSTGNGFSAIQQPNALSSTTKTTTASTTTAPLILDPPPLQEPRQSLNDATTTTTSPILSPTDENDKEESKKGGEEEDERPRPSFTVTFTKNVEITNVSESIRVLDEFEKDMLETETPTKTAAVDCPILLNATRLDKPTAATTDPQNPSNEHAEDATEEPSLQEEGDDQQESDDNNNNEDNAVMAKSRQKTAAAAALLLQRSTSSRTSSRRHVRSTSNNNNNKKTPKTTSVGARRTGSATVSRQRRRTTKGSSTSEILTAARRAPSVAAVQPQQQKQQQQQQQGSNDSAKKPSNSHSASSSSRRSLEKPIIRSTIDGMLQNQATKRQARAGSPPQQSSYDTFGMHRLLHNPPPGTVLMRPSKRKRTTAAAASAADGQKKHSHWTQDALSVRLATTRDDFDIANLRLSVFSNFGPQVRRQFCARSCQVLASRRVRGATCLVATVPRNQDDSNGRGCSDVVLGSVECSIHEFFGTTLGRRRRKDSILYMTEVAVNPVYRRCGIGTTLLQVGLLVCCTTLLLSSTNAFWLCLCL